MTMCVDVVAAVTIVVVVIAFASHIDSTQLNMMYTNIELKAIIIYFTLMETMASCTSSLVGKM